MIGSDSSGGTVIAADPCFGLRELARHGLHFDMSIHFSPLQLHVDSAAVAYRTLVGSLHVSIVTITMHVMTTLHSNNGYGRSKHPVSANRAIAFCGTFYTPVCVCGGYVDAHITFLLEAIVSRETYSFEMLTNFAMNIVLSQSFTNPTYTAVLAVIYSSSGIVVPKLTDIAIVHSCLLVASSTVFRSGLWRATQHT